MNPQLLQQTLSTRGVDISAAQAAELAAACDEFDDALVLGHFRRLRNPERYLREWSAERIAEHLRLLSKLNDQQLVAVSARKSPADDGFTVEVAGVDLLGVSACITGALAEMGLSIVGMEAMTYLPDSLEGEDVVQLETHGVRNPGLYILSFDVDEGDHTTDADELTHSLRSRLKAAYWHLLRGDVQGARHKADEMDPLIGTILGDRFRVDRQLARGGMGTIYLATQTDLERPVIVKVLREECTRDAEVARTFEREARFLAQTQSPHVVHIYATGTIEDRCWMALEYMVGGDVEHWTARHGVPPFTLAAQWLHEALSGLAYIHHEAGIVHCDIKPSNLLLDAGRKLKIGDLGLSQLRQAAQPQEGEGSVRGTLWYMSPEQARGEPLDARSDLFSLGSTFYHILTRVRPFDASAPAQILARVSHGECDPIPKVAPDVPPGMAVIVERLMQADPERRYQNAGVALADLESYAALRGGAESVFYTEPATDWTPPLRPDDYDALEATKVR